MPTLGPEKSQSSNRLFVDWQDSVWSPVVSKREPMPDGAAKSSPPADLPCHNRHRRHRQLSQLMNMNIKESRRSGAGFTLVELLTVIAIIAILAAMLLPVLAAAKRHAQVVKAKLDIGQLLSAIQSYNSDYGRFPISKEAQAAAVAATILPGQFTYGGTFKTPGPTPDKLGTQVNGDILTNDAVIAILMNITNYPNTLKPTANAFSQKNPRQIQYLNAPQVSDATLPGVGPDLVYRDPWGNPYVITMDLNDDSKAEDFFYSKSGISGGGINGLLQQPPPDNNYALHGNIMVWSAGPDGKIDVGSPANAGVNKDNVLSWK